MVSRATTLSDYVIIGTYSLTLEQELDALFTANKIDWVPGEGSLVYQIMVPKALATKAALAITQSPLRDKITVYSS